MKDLTPKKTLEELLHENYQWPTLYTFKVVLPLAKENLVHQIFQSIEHTLSKKHSQKGNYVALTIKANQNNPQDVLLFYRKLSQIKGSFIL